ncbi:MAG: HEAT repeat domain-containing protein, partial [candidate division Zixibacteria bacterium]|nr:HEAT repeat domain-containing protein [candidate division Zixibacteria bacterium]
MTNYEDKKSRQFEDIQMILRDLLKVFKVVALYPEGNPLPESLRRTFSERLVDLVADYGELDFGINQDKILYQSEVAFTDHSREEALAGLFFETGIIRITFKQGIDVEEVYRLLDAVKMYQNSDHQTADLAANLWEAELKYFKFETVEDIALRQYDGDALIQVLEQAENGNYQQIACEEAANYQDIFTEAGSTDPLASDSGGFENSFLADTDQGIDVSQAKAGSILSTGDADVDAGLQISEAVEAMGLGDLTGDEPSESPTPPVLPDTKLILNDELKLSEEEQEQVDRLVRRDAEFIEYESLCELMKEILHQEAEMTDFYESVTIGERVLVEFIKQGKLTYAAELLRYFVKLEEQLRSDRPLWAERLKDARVMAGSRERLAILCEALNDNGEIGSLELRGYLDNFDWESLMGITDMLGELKIRLHRDTVTDYLTLRGKDRIQIVARGITDKRPAVVAASATILARIGTEQALQYLAKGIDHPESEVRRTMVSALADCPNDDSLPLLRR